jgi:hypothetical protein
VITIGGTGGMPLGGVIVPGPVIHQLVALAPTLTGPSVYEPPAHITTALGTPVIFVQVLQLSGHGSIGPDEV